MACGPTIEVIAEADAFSGGSDDLEVQVVTLTGRMRVMIPTGEPIDVARRVVSSLVEEQSETGIDGCFVLSWEELDG